MCKKLLVLALIMAFVLMAGSALAQQTQEHPKQAPQAVETPKQAPQPPTPPVAKTEEPCCTITIRSVSQAIGVGRIWGQGLITYGGKTHQFKIQGFEKFAVGREKLAVNGDVYRLKQLSDLAGKYRKADPAGITFIAKPKGLVIQNDKGVVIDLAGKERGLQLEVGKDGVKIKDIKI
jgi:hypothetical protein